MTGTILPKIDPKHRIPRDRPDRHALLVAAVQPIPSAPRHHQVPRGLQDTGEPRGAALDAARRLERREETRAPVHGLRRLRVPVVVGGERPAGLVLQHGQLLHGVRGREPLELGRAALDAVHDGVAVGQPGGLALALAGVDEDVLGVVVHVVVIILDDGGLVLGFAESGGKSGSQLEYVCRLVSLWWSVWKVN